MYGRDRGNSISSMKLSSSDIVKTVSLAFWQSVKRCYEYNAEESPNSFNDCYDEYIEKEMGCILPWNAEKINEMSKQNVICHTLLLCY